MSKTKEESIYDAAIDLFAVRGYEGTTVPMIADNAKVGAGTIYRYFENKESLLNSLFSKCVTEFSNTIKHQFPFDASIRMQFAHIFHQLFQFARHHVKALQFINSHRDSYYLNQESKQVFGDFLSFIMSKIELGKEQGIIRPLPSSALIAMVYGSFVMIFNMMQSGALEESAELLQELEESAWNAIRII